MQFVRDARKVTAKALEYTALETWGKMRINVPKDHGRLANSFLLNKIDDYEYRIISGVRYALDVNNGTGVYGPTGQPIKPKTKKALKFIWHGKTIIAKGDLPNKQSKAAFAKWAKDNGMEPMFSWPKGQKGSKYVERSVQQASSRVDEFIRRAIAVVGP
jgi:hypothetical protein